MFLSIIGPSFIAVIPMECQIIKGFPSLSQGSRNELTPTPHSAVRREETAGRAGRGPAGQCSRLGNSGLCWEENAGSLLQSSERISNR